ncbi:hypothetical protein ACNKHL_14685 [Shigella flexneri]
MRHSSMALPGWRNRLTGSQENGRSRTGDHADAAVSRRDVDHVKVLSQLARKLVNKNFRQSLFAAQDARSILTLLETELTF